MARPAQALRQAAQNCVRVVRQGPWWISICSDTALFLGKSSTLMRPMSTNVRPGQSAPPSAERSARLVGPRQGRRPLYSTACRTIDGNQLKRIPKHEGMVWANYYRLPTSNRSPTSVSLSPPVRWPAPAPATSPTSIALPALAYIHGIGGLMFGGRLGSKEASAKLKKVLDLR